jgi:hypothetical protein
LIGGLATPRTVSEPVILAPHRLARPVFNDLTQTLSWAIEDKDGQWLSLSLPHDGDQNSAMLADLETIAQSTWNGRIIALADVEGGHYRLRPFALWDGDKLTSLGLDAVPKSKEPVRMGFASRLVSGLADRLSNLPRQFVPLPKGATHLLLANCWQRLVEMAEIGIGVPRDYAGGLRLCARRLTDAGLPALGEAMDRVHTDAKPNPAAYFRACYMIRLAQRQMIDAPIVLPIG